MATIKHPLTLLYLIMRRLREVRRANKRVIHVTGECTRCSGMVGYRDVRYVFAINGTKAEEELPAGRIKRRWDHCGAVGDFNLQNLRPTSVKFLIPRLP